VTKIEAAGAPISLQAFYFSVPYLVDMAKILFGFLVLEIRVSGAPPDETVQQR